MSEPARYRVVRAFESEDGRMTIVEKVPSWLGGEVSYECLTQVIGKRPGIGGVLENVPVPVQFPLEAKTIDEAFNKSRQAYEDYVAGMNAKTSIVQAATANMIPKFNGRIKT
jgi:hypothetical protein